MPARPWILAESPYAAVRDLRYEVAVLPWGATEAHNLHLPYATDTMQCDAVAAEAARVAWERGGRVVVLPTVPFGVQTGQRDIPFCINMNPSTQAMVLADVARSVEPHGVRKLVILNGHGGNDFRQMLRELAPRTPLFCCAVNWWSALDARPFFDQPGDHAGELETSVMMHVAPDLVLPIERAGEGRARTFRVAALREGWAWAQRDWSRVTSDTGVGDPRAATPQKGERFLRAAGERIGGFLADLAAADLEELYA